MRSHNMKLVEPDENYYEQFAVDILARTMYGEALGFSVLCGVDMYKAIASVVMNRVAVSEERGGYWWGKDIITVCQKPYQFSCWNRSSPFYKRMQQWDDRDDRFYLCKKIALQCVQGRNIDFANGATHYHYIHSTPDWARMETPCFTVNEVLFYRLVG